MHCGLSNRVLRSAAPSCLHPARVQNHDKKFYDFLYLVMPDWRARKERLERVFL